MRAAVLWACFSPFHVARLEQAGLLGRSQGHELFGFETAAMQGEYAWPETSNGGQHFQRRVSFPNKDYWSVPFRAILRAIWQGLDKVAPDVVVLPGWGTRDALAGLTWCLARRVPRVLVSDSQPIDNSRSAAREWLKRMLVRQFHAAFVGGSPHRRYIRELGLADAQCVVGCDVVDNQWFDSESRRFRELDGTRTTRKTLLSCVRLIPSKNIPGALDAFARQNVNWTWLIAGHGPERAAVERMIDAHSLRGRVRLLGHVEYSQLPRLYAHASAYLQPSLSEPWGLAVNEAMASGLPVVVSKRCGCHEDLVQEDVNGFTFDPTEISGLSDALNKLAKAHDRWQAMGEASRRIVAGWGLGLFASSLWQACGIALRMTGPRTLQSGLTAE